MSLNDEQADHVQSLARNPDLVCGCGWFFKAECNIHCSHPQSRLPEQSAHNDTRNLAYSRAASLVKKQLDQQYPLRDTPEYKQSNALRSYTRVVLERLLNDIEGLKR